MFYGKLTRTTTPEILSVSSVTTKEHPYKLRKHLPGSFYIINEKVKNPPKKLILKKLPFRFFFTLQGCSLVVNDETDKISGVVVRVSFPLNTLFQFVPRPPNRARSSRFVGNLKQQWSHIGVFIFLSEYWCKKIKCAHLWYTPFEPL